LGFAELLKTFKGDSSSKGVIRDLDRYLIGKRRRISDLGRPYEGRAPKYHHPSQLSSVDCIRRLTYDWLGVKASNDLVTAVSQRIFDTGHDFGYRMQGYFWDMGILLGGWLCLDCKHEWQDLDNPSPTVCPRCGTALEIWYNLHYLEVPIVDNEHQVAGKCDGILKRKFGRQIVELKTIKSRVGKSQTEGFEDLSAPKSAHLSQINLYMEGARKQYGNDTDFTEGVIIYTGKNKQLLKEFPVVLMPEILQQVYVKAEMVDSAIKTRVLPARTLDTTSYSCKYCKYLDFCRTNDSFQEALENVKEE
jgi:CRISPR/Cas system-associated exonuclease Cas4 (RecB family)